MAKILIADDESKIRRILCDFLKRDGHEIIDVGTGTDVLEILKKDEKIDLFLLDIMLPGCDGWELCRTIRKTSNTPVILLTARSAESDEIRGFDAGADDYITKPFSPIVVTRRIAALLKRFENDHSVVEQEILVLDGLTINSQNHQVKIDDNNIELTIKEFNILQKLVANRDRVYTREQLLDDIWGFDYAGDARNVDSHVARLRSKLGDWGSKHLKTIYGIGYKIEVNV